MGLLSTVMMHYVTFVVAAATVVDYLNLHLDNDVIIAIKIVFCSLSNSFDLDL